MTEFFTQGTLASGGANLAVHDNRNSPVPWRILQSGPGDYCRIAFQTAAKQHALQDFLWRQGRAAEIPSLDRLGRAPARDPTLEEL